MDVSKSHWADHVFITCPFCRSASINRVFRLADPLVCYCDDCSGRFTLGPDRPRWVVALTESATRVHTLWTFGSLCCVLVASKSPEKCRVQVFNEDRLVVTARCKDADEASVLAERFWDLFIDTT